MKCRIFVPILFTFVLLSGLTADAAAGNYPDNVGAKCFFPSFIQEFERSGAVFVGEVLKESKDGNNKEFVFLVNRYWKGISSRKLTIRVAENPRFKAQFKEGKTYLVFARKDEDTGTLYDGRCSRSAQIGGYSSNLKDDLEKLGDVKTCIDLKGGFKS